MWLPYCWFCYGAYFFGFAIFKKGKYNFIEPNYWIITYIYIVIIFFFHFFFWGGGEGGGILDSRLLKLKSLVKVWIDVGMSRQNCWVWCLFVSPRKRQQHLLYSSTIDQWFQILNIFYYISCTCGFLINLIKSLYKGSLSTKNRKIVEAKTLNFFWRRS